MIDLTQMSKQEKIIIGSLLAAILLIILVMFNPANLKTERKAAAVPQNILTTGGAQGSDRGYFQTPKDIAVDKEGFVYVVDSRNSRIQKFSNAGNFVLSWGKDGSGPGDMKEPCGIDIGPDGNVYVADTWNGRVEIFNNSGSFLMAVGGDLGLWGPRDVAVDKDGNIYIVDTGNFLVYKLDKAGKKLAAWGKKRNGVEKGTDKPGEFFEPFSIKQGPDGNIYIADRVNYRIQVMSTSGKYIREFKVNGWALEQVSNGCLMEPYFDIDKAKRTMFITDSTNHRVLKYNLEGTLLKTITTDTKKQKMGCPMGVAVFTGGQLLVTDSAAGKINVLEE